MKLCQLLIAALFLLANGSVYAQDAASDSTLLDEIRLELEERYELDQNLRHEIAKLSEEKGFDSEEVQALWKEQIDRDEENIARLVEIIDLIGWPGKSKVGPKGASAGFLILQHASYEHQKKYLPIVRATVEDGELNASMLALLEDRILVHEGKPQLYGTQLYRNPDTGELELNEIHDEENVDERRAKMGLGPLSEYAKHFGLEYTTPKK